MFEKFRGFISYQIALLNRNTKNPKKVAMFFEFLKLPSLIFSFWVSWNVYMDLVNTDCIPNTFLGLVLTSFGIILKYLFMCLFPACLGIFIDANSRY